MRWLVLAITRTHAYTPLPPTDTLPHRHRHRTPWGTTPPPPPGGCPPLGNPPPSPSNKGSQNHDTVLAPKFSKNFRPFPGRGPSFFPGGHSSEKFFQKKIADSHSLPARLETKTRAAGIYPLAAVFVYVMRSRMNVAAQKRWGAGTGMMRVPHLCGCFFSVLGLQAQLFGPGVPLRELVAFVEQSGVSCEFKY